MNQEMTELQEKYSQKAAQASNLSETAARLQAENEHLLATLHQQGIRLPQPSYRHQHHRPSPPGASTPRTGQIVPFQPLPGFASAQRHQSIHQSHQYGSNRRQSISPREPSPNQQQPPPGFPNLPSSHGGLLSPHMSPPPPNGRSHNDMARPSQHPAVHSSQQFQPGLKATLPQQLHQFNPRHQQHHQQMGGRQLKQPPLPGFPASPSNVATM